MEKNPWNSFSKKGVVIGSFSRHVKGEKSKWDKVKSKGVTLGSFARHCRDHVKIQQELEQFLKEMKQSREGIEKDLKSEAKSKFYVRKQSVMLIDRALKTKCSIERKYRNSVSSDQDEVPCSVCQEPFDPFKDTIYPCRVCDNVFHKKCALSLKNIHRSHIKAIERANSNTGWSCHVCDDLSHLLTEEELNTLIEKYEDIEVNRENQITIEEFMSYRKRNSDTPITAEDKHRLRIQFRLVDTDGNGLIDWWEFLTYETRLKLHSRTQEELIDILTVKEVDMAKQLFARLDTDNDGFISQTDARRAFFDWYKRFEEAPNKTGVITSEKDGILEQHAQLSTKQVMEADTSKKGNVKWEDYLAEQAVYIIGSRPNLAV